jgi:hypothetical protein
MGERVGQIAKMPEVKQSNSNSRVRRTEHLQSMDTPVDSILFLQRTAGNQAVSRLMRSGALQAKLKIGQPGDKYELPLPLRSHTAIEKLRPQPTQTLRQKARGCSAMRAVAIGEWLVRYGQIHAY